MDLRLYTKSGNVYYVDISHYDFDYILNIISECMQRGDLLTISNNNQVDVINGKELEYFEIIKNDEVEEIISNSIGFNK